VSEDTASEDTRTFEYTLDVRRVSFTIDEDLYPRDALYGAAYLFVERCYVFLDRLEEQKVSVQLTAKGEADEAALEALAGEFANELLNQVLRLRVGQSTARIREYYLAKAFFTEPDRAGIDALLAELDAEELEEDPLEIEVPWETNTAAAAAPTEGSEE